MNYVNYLIHLYVGHYQLSIVFAMIMIRIFVSVTIKAATRGGSSTWTGSISCI